MPTLCSLPRPCKSKAMWKLAQRLLNAALRSEDATKVKQAYDKANSLWNDVEKLVEQTCAASIKQEEERRQKEAESQRLRKEDEQRRLKEQQAKEAERLEQERLQKEKERQTEEPQQRKEQPKPEAGNKIDLALKAVIASLQKAAGRDDLLGELQAMQQKLLDAKKVGVQKDIEEVAAAATKLCRDSDREVAERKSWEADREKTLKTYTEKMRKDVTEALKKENGLPKYVAKLKDQLDKADETFRNTEKDLSKSPAEIAKAIKKIIQTLQLFLEAKAQVSELNALDERTAKLNLPANDREAVEGAPPDYRGECPQWRSKALPSAGTKSGRQWTSRELPRQPRPPRRASTRRNRHKLLPCFPPSPDCGKSSRTLSKEVFPRGLEHAKERRQ